MPLKRKTPLKAKAPLKRTGRPRATPRTAREFARVYGGPERAAWMRAQRCVACGGGPCDNAHIVSGGMGRKADADQVVPLCTGPHGCHAVLHRIGRVSFERQAKLDLAKEAAKVQTRWEGRNG